MIKRYLMVAFFTSLMWAQSTTHPQKSEAAKKPAQTPAGKKAESETAGSPKEPKSTGFNINALDRTADPCNNFYQFACGSWMKNNPIPADQSRWSRFNELAERNRLVEREILEAAARGGSNRNAVDQKIGDFYGACMDEETINKAGLNPLKSWMDSINNIKTKQDVTTAVIAMHRTNGPGFFSFGSGQDFKNSSEVIAQFDQGGLGLPNKEYYTRTDPKSVSLREKYVQHVANMFKLAGEDESRAAADAKAVMEIEQILAQGSYTPVERRNPEKVYHRMPEADFQKLAPDFDFARYMVGIGAPKVNSLNVGVPEFAKAMQQIIQARSLADIQTYLRWHAIHEAAPLLPTKFVDENFNFYGKTLSGQEKLQDRWKRCTRMTDNSLGEALGIAYVQKTFPPDAKQRMLKLVQNLEKSLGADIRSLDWMSPATKQQAIAKLTAIANKIGYPEKWRDYSSVHIAKGDAWGNSQRAGEFELHRQLDKIGKPVDKMEWLMTPPTVNAYYDPQMNNINFPAGILQPPFFDNAIDDAVNYGGIGAVIGHELTHGFDDQGSQFDAQGNLRDWWTAADKAAFKQRTQCVVDEYSGFKVDDINVNGKLTLGENAADNGGLRIAYMALMEALKQSKDPGKIDGFTPEQRIFLGWGQVWCENQKPEAARLQVQSDPHSPGSYRVNGTVQNMEQFRQAWACKAGTPMAPEKTCRVW